MDFGERLSQLANLGARFDKTAYLYPLKFLVSGQAWSLCLCIFGLTAAGDGGWLARLRRAGPLAQGGSLCFPPLPLQPNLPGL